MRAMDIGKTQTKIFSLKFDDADTNGMIRGYASTFGNVDYGLDIVDKGAFKKSIKENSGKFPILADHNPSRQIGWNLRAQEDDKGLYVEGQLDLNVQDAREKFSLIKTALDNDINMGLSIGYMTIKAEPDRDKPMVRHLKELKLFEYSVVTFPMNVEAMVTDAKTSKVQTAKFFIDEMIKKGFHKDELEMALRNGAAGLEDPSSLTQSMDDLISIVKSSLNKE